MLLALLANHPNLGGVARRRSLHDGCTWVGNIVGRINRQAAGKIRNSEAIVQCRDDPSFVRIRIRLRLHQGCAGRLTPPRIAERKAASLVNDFVGAIGIFGERPLLTCARGCRIYRRKLYACAAAGSGAVPQQTGGLIQDPVGAVCQPAELASFLEATEGARYLEIER